MSQTGASHGIDTAFPKDPRSVHSHFNLDPITSHYLSCANCHKLYPYFGLEKTALNSSCSHTSTPDGPPCGTSLWKDRAVAGGQFRPVPVRVYQHQDLKSWVGRLICRPRMEKILDEYPLSQMGDDELANDVWGCEVFKNLKDSRGQPFVPGPQGEGRLVFSLSIDGFQTFGNKIAKQTASSTGIWMVLLNLPWYMRYLPENIYLAGIIPGPNKPSTDEINHYLELVVSDLLDFWGPGIFYSRTHECATGRLFRAMLVPLVCDMLSIRQVIAYANATTSHYFCMLCDLDIDDIHFIDRQQWP